MSGRTPRIPRRTAADGISRWRSEAERREVNEALDRNATWREIAAICAKHGRRGVTAANVSHYRNSKDRAEWRAYRERLETIRQESEITAAIVRHYSEHGGSPAEAGLLAAAEVLTKVISSFPESDLRQMLQDDPRQFIRAIDSLKAITSYIQRERFAEPNQSDPPESDPQERRRKILAIFGLSP